MPAKDGNGKKRRRRRKEDSHRETDGEGEVMAAPRGVTGTTLRARWERRNPGHPKPHEFPPLPLPLRLPLPSASAFSTHTRISTLITPALSLPLIFRHYFHKPPSSASPFASSLTPLSHPQHQLPAPIITVHYFTDAISRNLIIPAVTIPPSATLLAINLCSRTTSQPRHLHRTATPRTCTTCEPYTSIRPSPHRQADTTTITTTSSFHNHASPIITSLVSLQHLEVLKIFPSFSSLPLPSTRPTPLHYEC